MTVVVGVTVKLKCLNKELLYSVILSPFCPPFPFQYLILYMIIVVQGQTELETNVWKLSPTRQVMCRLYSPV